MSCCGTVKRECMDTSAKLYLGMMSLCQVVKLKPISSRLHLAKALILNGILLRGCLGLRWGEFRSFSELRPRDIKVLLVAYAKEYIVS